MRKTYKTLVILLSIFLLSAPYVESFGLATAIESNDDNMAEEIDKDIDKQNNDNESSKLVHEDTNQMNELLNETHNKKNDFRIQEDHLKEEPNEESNHNNITPFVGTVNIDVDISPVENEVKSGERARYRMIFKTTGANEEILKGTVLKVSLPSNHGAQFNQELEELKIAGVIPELHPSTNELIYNFKDELRTGRTYETIIVVDTQNLITPNGTEFKVIANLILNNQQDHEKSYTDEAIVNVIANEKMSITKKYRESRRGGEVERLPKPGDYTIWDIKVTIPKDEVGQLRLNEGSVIRIQDEIPQYLEIPENENIIMVDGTRSPSFINRAQNLLTWDIDAPSLEEQENAVNDLFSITLSVRLRVKNNTVGRTVTNKAIVRAGFLGQNERRELTDTDSIGIVDSDGNTGDIEGLIIAPVHVGPLNGQGNIPVGENRELNPRPTVTDDAILQFRHGVTANPIGSNRFIRNYKSTYKIDPNLRLEQIRTPDEWIYATTNEEIRLNIPLGTEPNFTVIAVIADGTEFPIRNAKSGTEYKRSDFGVGPNQRITEIRYEFIQMPRGAHTRSSAQYYFTPRKGYTGWVENKFNFTAEKNAPKRNGQGYCPPNRGIYNAQLDICEYDYKRDSPGYEQIASDRQAYINSNSTNNIPIGTVDIVLLEESGGEIVPGDNRVRIRLLNQASSTANFVSQMEASVLLPPGVTIKPNASLVTQYGNGEETPGDQEILSNNFNGTGRQLILVRWNDILPLSPGRRLEAYFDVDISDNIAPEIRFDVFGYVGNEDISVPSTGTNPLLTTSILDIDTEDYNGNGDNLEKLIRSGRKYRVRGYYDLETEKLVKGELDNEYSLIGETKPGGKIEYLLKLTNNTGKDIHLMTLIDVLPSVGDLGITDNTQRGSKFTPTLNGPITVPVEWKDKVRIYYSKSKNPSRSDLIRNTVWPETTIPIQDPSNAEPPVWQLASELGENDFSEIHSFKIELVDNETFINGQDIEINFSMTAPEFNSDHMHLYDRGKDISERWACNSFATATDHGQPVEPYKVCAFMTVDFGSVEILKVDSTDEDKRLAGAEFKLTMDPAGNNVVHQESLTVNGEEYNGALEGLVTDENGILKVENLLMGTYYLHETKAPEGYKITKMEPIEIVISEDGQLIQKTVDNQPVKASLKVIKKDQVTKEMLAGAEFELRNLDHEVIQGPKITNENGEVTFIDLELGKYLLYETRAPEGYRILTKPIEIEIQEFSEDSLYLEIIVENSKADWELPETGGIGTAIFYGLGLLFMMGALIFSLKRKRED